MSNAEDIAQYVRELHERLEYRPVAVAILFNREDRVLLCKTRTPNAETPWSFPQGGIENGELLAIAMIRELKEELGDETAKITELKEGFMIEKVDAEAGRIDKRGFSRGKAYIFSVASFVGDPNALVLNPKEVERAEWLDQQGAEEYLRLARLEKATMLTKALKLARQILAARL